MAASTQNTRSPFKFFVLVYVFALPFLLLGSIPSVEDAWSRAIPMNLPISAFMFVVPIMAALILTKREQGVWGMRLLLRRTFDFKRITHKAWYFPTLFLIPIVVVLSYVVMRVTHAPLPELQIPILQIPVIFFIYFIAAIGEEVGWTGYAIDPLQQRWGALGGALILGSVWALLHVIPYAQAHNSSSWILWMCLGTVATRVIMVWLYNNMGKSLFAMLLYHTMINVSWTLFPNYGSHYDPFIVGIFIFIIATFVTVLWGMKTLSRYRFA